MSDCGNDRLAASFALRIYYKPPASVQPLPRRAVWEFTVNVPVASGFFTKNAADLRKCRIDSVFSAVSTVEGVSSINIGEHTRGRGHFPPIVSGKDRIV